MINESKHIDKIDRLIVRFKNDDISQKEQSELLTWIKQSGDNKAYYQKSVTILDRIDSARLEFDTDAAFDKFLSQTKKEPKVLRFSPWLRIAASVVVILGVALGIFLNRPVTDVVVLSDITIVNEDLPDKTEVVLNKGSKLVYPSRFTDEVRKVEIKGEAYFDVHHNERKPFIVNAGPVEIQVLGTSFDVYNDTLLKVTTVIVESGKVKVSYPDNGFIAYLEPNDKCVVDWGEKVVKQNRVDDANYKAWLTKLLVFDGAALSKVIRDLNQVYDKKIIIADQNLNNCKLTTKIDNYPQQEVLTILEKSLNLEVIDNGEMYILIGDGCVQ